MAREPAAARARRLRRPRPDAARAAARRRSPGCSAGIFATVLVAFVVFGFSDARPSATAAISRHAARRRLGRRRARARCCSSATSPRTGGSSIFTVLFTVFADDTAAYFVGRTFGRHKMAPTISPGKSWEGFVGGTRRGDRRRVLRPVRPGRSSRTSEALALGAVDRARRRRSATSSSPRSSATSG